MASEIWRRAVLKLTTCHAERSGEKSEAILTAQSKHPYPRSQSGFILGAL